MSDQLPKINISKTTDTLGLTREHYLAVEFHCILL